MRLLPVVAALAAALILMAAEPKPAAAVSPVGVMCTIGGVFSGLLGKACNAATHAGSVLSAGKKLLGGHVGGALKALGGGTGSAAKSVATKATFVVALGVIGSWIGGGAHAALGMVAGLVGKTTRPDLRSTWFSGTYWRVAAISALLTLPFLFAAAVQALLRADITLLWRAALGYLPLALLAVALAAPLIMLLLSAVDGMSNAVSSAAGGAAAHFLRRMTTISGVLTALSHSPFLACFLAVLLVFVSVVLWLELLVRDAAIYVVVLMLPLAFATFVWPARRMWVTRAAELLFALILSKFAIVAVLSLGGAALNAGGITGAGTMSLGLVLVALAATAPWALMRLLPMAELAGSLQGLRGGGLAQHPLAALERGEQGHTLAEERLALDSGPVTKADTARQEMAKLGSADPAREPATPASDGSAAETDAGATLIPAPQSDGVYVAGHSNAGSSGQPLSPQTRATLGGDRGPELVLGVEGQGAAPAPPSPPLDNSAGEIKEPPPPKPDPPANATDPGPPVDPDVLPRDEPDVRPPEEL